MKSVWNRVSDVPPPDWKWSLLAIEDTYTPAGMTPMATIAIGFSDPVANAVYTVHGAEVHPTWWMPIPPLPKGEEDGDNKL